jgi:hypothetical protein
MNPNEKPISGRTGFSLPLLSKSRWPCPWVFADIPGKKQVFTF